MERLAASPGTAADLIAQWYDMDVRRVLPAIRVPTLVLSLKNQPVYNPMLSRYVADHIPGARFVELEGTDLLIETNAMFPAIEDFLGASYQQSDPDRSVGTVLFTDIVGSTGIAARIGDLRWRDLLEIGPELRNARSRSAPGDEVSPSLQPSESLQTLPVHQPFDDTQTLADRASDASATTCLDTSSEVQFFVRLKQGL